MKLYTKFLILIFLTILSCKIHNENLPSCAKSQELTNLLSMFESNENKLLRIVKREISANGEFNIYMELQRIAKNALNSAIGCDKNSVLKILNNKYGVPHYEGLNNRNNTYRVFYFIFDLDNCNNIKENDSCDHLKFVFKNAKLVDIAILPTYSD